MLSSIFEQFVKESPVTVMTQVLMERVLSPERIGKLFDAYKVVGYQQDLPFSSQVDLISLVVCGICPSVHAAYKARAIDRIVGTTVLYNKLYSIELNVSQALVRETANDLVPIVEAIGGEQPSLLPGYQFKIVDSTCPTGTDSLLNTIRTFVAKPLPGKAIVVLDSKTKLVTDIFPCLDGDVQESSLFDDVLYQVKSQELWCAKNNFCTAKFLFTIASKKAFFVIHQDKGLDFRELGELKPLGETKTGKLFEQKIEISYEGETLEIRRVLLKQFVPARDKEGEIEILTNLPFSNSNAAKVVELSQNNWRLESLLQTVNENYNEENETLSDPKVAMFSFSMALVAYNILATIRAALRSVHGAKKIEFGLLDFYLVDEIQAIYKGMMIAIPSPQWERFRMFSIEQIIEILKKLATGVNIKGYLTAIKGLKKSNLWIKN